MTLVEHDLRLHGYRIGKCGTSLDTSIFRTLAASSQHLETLTAASSGNIVYYQEACRYWVKACKGLPFFRRNGQPVTPPHGRTICFASNQESCFATCLLNSTLFYRFYSGFSDCEHVNDALIRDFRVPASWDKEDWSALEQKLANSLKQHSQRKVINTKQGHEIEYDELNGSQSKSVIDDIDVALARHYGFTEEQLDFIINYDIKYRLGDSGVEDE